MSTAVALTHALSSDETVGYGFVSQYRNSSPPPTNERVRSAEETGACARESVCVCVCVGDAWTADSQGTKLRSQPRQNHCSFLHYQASEINRLGMDGCAQLCKCFLILFNILFALVGLGLVSLGIWLRFGAETRGFFDIDLNTSQFTIGVAVLIVTGALMLLVAVIGDCGACNHSKSALGVFSGLLSFVIIIEIAAGVMAFMWSGQVSDELAKFYMTIYTQYLNTRSPGQAMTLKLFHNAFDCCGIGGPIELLVRDTCPDGNFLKQITFPSCPNVIQDMFNSKAPLVLGGFLGTAGIMLVALVCSSVLYNSLKSSVCSTPSYY